ncbi:CHASE2 domain-containing protein [Sulfuriferula sp. AH1]|uniref:CHASE2 domain-containing protein n=1 Tax=Sulfuriferula sp. AH1 TaxID=1985873 RepID=UPI001CB95FBD|nr:adenylate/guanylate cyclase domain-containing protein [Sulfuriferula sp. AH1]
MFKQHLPRMILSLLITVLLVLHTAGVVRLSMLDRLEAWSYDTRLLLTMPHELDPRIVVIDIDEASLKQIGQWPWGRDRLAQLTSALLDRYHVAAIGYDVVFAEPDTRSGLASLTHLAATHFKQDKLFKQALDKARPLLDYDARFAQSMSSGPVVLGYYFTPYPQTEGALPQPVFTSGVMAGLDRSFVHNQGYGSNIPQLQHAAATGGYFNMSADFDGVTRRMPMLADYHGAAYEALSLATLRAALGAQLQLHKTGDTQWWPHSHHLELLADDMRIPLDAHGAILVPYRAYPGYTYLSAADVINGRAPAGLLENAIALVGTTAPGLLDLRVTPVAKNYPGVEIHANLISGILDGNIRYQPGFAHALELALLIVLGAGLAWILPRLTPLRGAILGLSLTVAYIAANAWAWQHNWVLPFAPVVLLIAGLMVLNMAWGYFAETRAKRQITGLFGQYVPPELVEEMSHDPSRFNMRSESKELSILFSDVRSFTTISESLTPQQLSDLLNEFLTSMTTVIHGYHGTIDKYMGDCIMAFWGAPLDNPQHARDAVLAGMAMQAALTELNVSFAARGWPQLHVGVGVNTGRVSVGNMGSKFRMAYTVMGDAVNLASRLEGITKQYAVPMVVGEATCAALPEMAFQELDLVRVKGKNKPVTIYQPLGLKAGIDAALVTQADVFSGVLADYRAQRWEVAETKLRALIQQTESTSASIQLYQIYLERINHLRQHPPAPDWDGVWVFESK